MTLRRTFDATFLNQVVNHPQVRPWLGQDRASPIRMDALVSDPKNVALVNEHGGFVFVQTEPKVFEVHTQFLPSGRGVSAVEAARQAARYMFKVIRADMLTTDVPADNEPALRLALKTGFEHAGVRLDIDGELSGKEQNIQELEMTRERFFQASAGWRDDRLSHRSEDGLCLSH